MYGGQSGCYGMIIYNTKLEDKNAVYGYYEGKTMRFCTGTVDEMREIKKQQEEHVPGGKGTGDIKVMAGALLIYLAAVAAGFAFLPHRMSLALLLFAVISYLPAMIIVMANRTQYGDERMADSFRRFHGCEHAIISEMTKKGDCTVESLLCGRIYDTECGTAYSGYAVFLAAELALMIASGIPFFRSLVVVFLSLVVLVIMILVPKINPFVMIQRPVVSRPTARECELGVEIVKRLKEL